LNERKFTLDLAAKNNISLILFLSTFLFTQCAQSQPQNDSQAVVEDELVNDTNLRIGATQFELYQSKLEGKRVAIVGNHTSFVDSIHLVDYLIGKDINVVKVFAPEHGFRGTADAGEKVESGKDAKTGLPIISLYGKNKKPTAEQYADVDVVIFDIQDVGARFYTYISTMHYVMEAAAENSKEVIVMDRPNPNGFYVDGPVLDLKYKSFIGMHPVPVVHGMTVGEYATMINEEGWLADSLKCNLTVVECQNYSHKDFYELPIPPSPNLPNMASVYLYPSLCFFEGTKLSVGRGTNQQFQIIGYPDFNDSTFSFTPKPNVGSKYPKFNGEECFGIDLSKFGANYFRNIGSLYFEWMTLFYESYPDKETFFRKDGFFTLLSGNKSLELMIKEGNSAQEIQSSWKSEVNEFKKIRKKYLRYEDFE